MEEKKSFEEYFKQHYDQAVGYTVKKVNNYDIAEDLVMNTFYSCFSKFDKFDPQKASFCTWLYFVLNNKIKNYFRDVKIHDDVDDVVVSVENFEDELVSAIELSNIRNELKLALESLNETQRTIVVLKYFHGKDATEIAEVLGMSHGNVRVQLMRGMNKIRDYFNVNNIEWEI